MSTTCPKCGKPAAAPVGKCESCGQPLGVARRNTNLDALADILGPDLTQKLAAPAPPGAPRAAPVSAPPPPALGAVTEVIPPPKLSSFAEPPKAPVAAPLPLSPSDGGKSKVPPNPFVSPLPPAGHAPLAPPTPFPITVTQPIVPAAWAKPAAEGTDASRPRVPPNPFASAPLPPGASPRSMLEDTVTATGPLTPGHAAFPATAAPLPGLGALPEALHPLASGGALPTLSPPTSSAIGADFPEAAVPLAAATAPNAEHAIASAGTQLAAVELPAAFEAPSPSPGAVSVTAAVEAGPSSEPETAFEAPSEGAAAALSGAAATPSSTAVFNLDSAVAEDASEVDDPEPIGRAQSPVTALRVAARALGAYVSSLGLLGKVGFALLPLCVLALLVLVHALARPAQRSAVEEPKPWRGFVAATQPLVSGPSPAFASAGLIERGEPVQLLESIAGFGLVKDEVGRVGYVLRERLVEEAPPAQPSEPFTRCDKRPSEIDASGCEARANAQLDGCKSTCAVAKTDNCEAQCDARHAACSELCQGRVPAPPSAAAPPPTEQGPEVTAAPEPPVVTEPPPPAKSKGRKAKVFAKRKGKHKGS